ncbi:MAG TPA: hypothetical protein VFH78_11505 [Candidatus Thermoplasmatota archaeon]|nr:hypothetical protein [Candidatus Thermoplasmatota archaeon]
MQRIDVLIVAALVLAAAGSVLGVMTYTDDRLATFTIEWDLRTSEADAPPASRTGAGDVETTLDVTQRNLTRATFSVTVGGAAARVQPVAVRVEVVSPTNDTTAVEGELPAGPGASVTLPVEVRLAEVPNAPTIQGPSLEAARHALNETLSSSMGVGAWTIRASFAPGAPGPLAGETFTLVVRASLESYQGSVVLLGPEVGR